MTDSDWNQHRLMILGRLDDLKDDTESLDGKLDALKDAVADLKQSLAIERAKVWGVAAALTVVLNVGVSFIT